MTLEEFRTDVLTQVQNRPRNVRYGQAVFNYIDYKYGVARFVQFKKHLDCFYNDDVVDDFINESYNAYESNI